ncbi:hypothetical protein B5E60_00520 [Alistipes sp. An116]|uniref:PL29 family lyase N-terminal domain-containing protein n=1 Tax=Alistipes sp. An116 TaxID=1965546 RepID=UPI000B3A4853|nr:PL29 family lyase N-terminal domain-containing protein [Alistipes sp. An116]OUQ54813.1 hypothetical protein B5E60_00520 [Alistipes sp. An116]
MKKYLILLFVAAAAVFQSCDNNDDLWDAIDDLKGRVQALETQVDALNNNVEAMKALYNGGATISEVSETGGTYTLKLTNGTTLTLTQGSEAEAVIPVVSIDAQGNWQYSVDSGKNFISLNVNAVAEDGVTPQFRVDEKTGVWQINTTGEESGWTNVKNTAGEDVSAIGGTVTDKFFDSVRTEGNVLYIKLLGGEELQIPIVADVLCEIVTTTEGIQMFDSGVERTFDVKMKGIDQTIVVAPEGWTARLTDPVEDVAKLYVKAPGALASAGTTATRATANSSQDVAILAMFGRYSCISKIQVQSTGVAAEPPTVTSVTPSATVLPTDVALTFDVQVANADGWKYICLESKSEAPEAAKVFAEGTAVLGTSVTVEGLKAETEYTIYVVAYMGEQYSEIATATTSTMETPPDPNDYYASGVEVNGISYDKNSEGAKLYTASESVSSLSGDKETKVYFLDGTEADNTFMNPATIYLSDQSIFIGRNKQKKTKLQMSGRFDMQNRNAIFGFKNLEIDMTQGMDDNCYMGLTGEAGVGGAKILVFEDCDITIGANKNLLRTFSNSPTDGYIEQIIFRNCKIGIDFTQASSTYAFFQVGEGHLSTGLTEFRKIVFENNVIYAKAGTVKPVSLFYHKWVSGSYTSNLSIEFVNNSTGDILGYTSGQPGHALFILGGCAEVTFSKNLIYSTQKQNPNAIIILAGGSYPTTVNSAANDNRYYNTNTTSSYAYKLFSTATGSITAEALPGGMSNVVIYRTDNLIDKVDLSTGTIKPTADHAAYGSSLE